MKRPFAPALLLVWSTLACACGNDVGFTMDARPAGDASNDAPRDDVASGMDSGGDVASEDASRDVAPTDVPFDPDAACAATTATATVERLPVDIIWVVDNSSSMQPAIDQITAGLNNFATLVGSRSLDYRVIMLSLRSPTNPVTRNGSTRYAVCIPQPLAGDSMCGNGERFFQSSIDIKSTQPLEQILGTLGQTSGFTAGTDRGGEPWRQFLRPEATKTFVVVSDDNSRLSADDFDHFAGGTNPFNSTVLPPGLLDASWGGLFDHYTFDGIYGWGSDTDPTVRCRYSDGTYPANAGPTYSVLVGRTSGVRAHICDGATAWGPFFDSIATAVEHTSRISCDLAIPASPDGSVLDPTRVNVALTGAMPAMPGKVAGASACGASGGWYYDDDAHPTRIFLCPASCDRAQMNAGTPDAGVQVRFGCQTIPG